jgi:hypothetical protein
LSVITQGYGSSAAAPTPPTIASVYPAAGTPIYPNTPISFQVLDDSGVFALIMLTASFAGSTILEVVYDGTAFGPMYTGVTNLKTATAGGYTFTILRDGGWPSAPSITPIAIDSLGAENA